MNAQMVVLHAKPAVLSGVQIKVQFKIKFKHTIQIEMRVGVAVSPKA